MERQPFVYILAGGRRGTLYIGVTSNLARRIWKHRSGASPGFTSRYKVWRLVHFEPFEDMENAISREKQLKALAPAVEDQLDRGTEPALGGFGYPLGIGAAANPGAVMLNLFQHPLPSLAAREGMDPETSSG